MTYTERRIGLHPNFDTFLRENWPAGTPEDCTKIEEGGVDCLDRVDPEMCPSCAEYDRLAGIYDRAVNGVLR